jgi:aspartate racemase
MKTEGQSAAVQRMIPGLVGMATPTNGAYLRALQSYCPVSGSASSQLNCLKAVLYEINFVELVQNVRGKQWLGAETQIAQAAIALKAAGAEFLVITSNTGSTLTRLASAECRLPILDIVGPTLTTVRNANRKRAGLLSTRRTSDSGIYQDAGRSHGLEVIAPSANIAEAIEHIIFNELIFGEVTGAGLDTMVAAAEWFARQGADALILGCTDMTHLAARLAARTPLLVADTTVIHANAAAQAAWSGVVEGDA